MGLVGMRESIANALYSGLGDSPEADTPVTRIGAFAGSTRLGTLLWRLKYANDAKSHKPVMLLLAQGLPRTMTWTYRRQIASQALQEWLYDMCFTCLGAKHVMADEKRVICPACEGLGKRRYNDKDRQGLSGQWLAEVSKTISEHDIDTDARTKARLER